MAGPLHRRRSWGCQINVVGSNPREQKKVKYLGGAIMPEAGFAVFCVLGKLFAFDACCCLSVLCCALVVDDDDAEDPNSVRCRSAERTSAAC